MSFFTHQQNARNNTTRFIILFIIGNIVIPIIIALLIAFWDRGYCFQNLEDYPWVMTLILLGGTLGIVIPVAIFKFNQFKVGGYIIAEQLGGRYIDAQNPLTFQEKQLTNIIAEMSIAANIPSPHLYILDAETSINAFAAGYTLNDAAIGITKGALDVLTREELMALVGHELSHILNEDMRINLRFTAIIFGMHVLITLTYSILRNFKGNDPRGALNKKNPNTITIITFATIFTIVGWVLALWGNIMQASVSRQREFLADASSAQFTRMPHAVASLLKKIGGSVEGSTIHTANSKAYSHMFFSSAARQLFSTHPSLHDRILHMEPNWDGNYIQPVPLYGGYHTQTYFPNNQNQSMAYPNNTQNDPFV